MTSFMPTYTAGATSLPGSSPAPWTAQNRRASVKSLDENDRFTAYCQGAVAKIRLSYIRLLARDKLDNSHEVLRRRRSKVTPLHQFGKPAQFTKRTITRTVSFTN
ncbi:hypothetical protein SPI_03657 [Niveomyces insectorum RCEF 264]|uniref:Uncharacterized protein n=1 Tax=Niveomyces insectorum RCEF 264 TaxID=1081102 RepID=A0A167W989_9HYPO|nr:hypothetical protein SPI_03657 [Niveomyces insectorum RCEF 264]